jgi:hypothetical protein
MRMILASRPPGKACAARTGSAGVLRTRRRSPPSWNVGKPRDVVDWRGKTVTTAIRKEPVAGPVRGDCLGGGRQAGGPRGPRRRAARADGLPDRVIPALAGLSRPRRFHYGAVRRESQGLRDGGRPGLRGRPVPGRWRCPRGEPAAGDLLQGPHPVERRADAGATSAAPRASTSPIVEGEFAYAIEPMDRPPDGRTLLFCAIPKSDVVIEL